MDSLAARLLCLNVKTDTQLIDRLRRLGKRPAWLAELVEALFVLWLVAVLTVLFVPGVHLTSWRDWAAAMTRLSRDVASKAIHLGFATGMCVLACIWIAVARKSGPSQTSRLWLLLLRLHEVAAARGCLPEGSSEPAPAYGFLGWTRARVRRLVGAPPRLASSDEAFVERLRAHRPARRPAWLAWAALVVLTGLLAARSLYGLRGAINPTSSRELVGAAVGAALGMLAGGAQLVFFTAIHCCVRLRSLDRARRLLLRYYDCLAERNALPEGLRPPATSPGH